MSQSALVILVGPEHISWINVPSVHMKINWPFLNYQLSKSVTEKQNFLDFLDVATFNPESFVVGGVNVAPPQVNVTELEGLFVTGNLSFAFIRKPHCSLNKNNAWDAALWRVMTHVMTRPPLWNLIYPAARMGLNWNSQCKAPCTSGRDAAAWNGCTRSQQNVLLSAMYCGRWRWFEFAAPFSGRQQPH